VAIKRMGAGTRAGLCQMGFIINNRRALSLLLPSRVSILHFQTGMDEFPSPSQSWDEFSFFISGERWIIFFHIHSASRMNELSPSTPREKHMNSFLQQERFPPFTKEIEE
jgi:hypothetical protein